jgi:hypothetical protein
MPSIKAIAHSFFKIRIDRVNEQSVGICNIMRPNRARMGEKSLQNLMLLKANTKWL